MTKFFVAYTIKGGLLVNVEDDDPSLASAKVRKFLESVPGNMESSITVHDLDELP